MLVNFSFMSNFFITSELSSLTTYFAVLVNSGYMSDLFIMSQPSSLMTYSSVLVNSGFMSSFFIMSQPSYLTTYSAVLVKSGSMSDFFVMYNMPSPLPTSSVVLMTLCVYELSLPAMLEAHFLAWFTQLRAEFLD